MSPGEVIARLDSREAQIQLEQAQAQLDGAAANTSRRKAK